MNPLVIPQISQSSIPDDIHWGIDAEKFSFPVNSELSLPLDSKWVQKPGRILEDGTQTYFYMADLPLGLYKMKVLLWEISSSCTVDFNPAHCLYGNNELLLPPAVNSLMIEKAIQATGLIPSFAQIDAEGTITWPTNWLESITIKELEVSRNFLIAPNYRKRLQQTLKEVVPTRGFRRNAQDQGEGFSLYFHTKSVGHDLFYNKTVQMRDTKGQQVAQTISHIYRFESRLDDSRLEKYGLDDPAKVNDQNVWRAIDERFHACGWNVMLIDSGALLEKLSGVRYQEIEQLLGFSEAVRLGLDQQMSIAVRRSRQKLAKNYGVTPGIAIKNKASVTSYLDLRQGRLVSQSPV